MDSEVSMELQNIHQKPELIKSANTRFKVKLSANTKLALIIFAIWFLAALHSLPHTVFNRVKTIRVLNKMHTDGNRTLSEEELNARTVTVRRCIPVWPKELGTNFNLYLTIFTTITQYCKLIRHRPLFCTLFVTFILFLIVIPLSCAGFIYLRIALTVQQLGKVGEISRGKAEQLTKKKRRRLLMLFFSFACFALSWAPFQVSVFGVKKKSAGGLSSLASFLLSSKAF